MKLRYEFRALVRVANGLDDQLDELLSQLSNVDLSVVNTGEGDDEYRVYRIFGTEKNVHAAALAFKVDANEIYVHDSDN